MDPELKKLLDSLNAFYAKATDKNEISVAIQKEIQPVYQSIFDSGFGAAKVKGDARAVELQAEVDKQKALTTEAATKLSDYEKQTPGLAKQREQYEATIGQLKTENETLKTNHKKELTDLRLGTDRKDLVMSLVNDHGVDPDYAAVIVQKAENADRIRYAADGVREVYQIGRDLPIAVADGENAIGVLAKAIAATVDAKWKTAKTTAGTGTRQGTGSTQTGTGNMFQRIRDEEKKKAEGAVTPNTRQQELAKRVAVLS